MWQTFQTNRKSDRTKPTESDADSDLDNDVRPLHMRKKAREFQDARRHERKGCKREESELDDDPVPLKKRKVPIDSSTEKGSRAVTTKVRRMINTTCADPAFYLDL
jgi:hypothetical protein